jgi:hypothetical protein
MAQARAARRVFKTHPRLASASPRYDAFVRSLAIVGKRLIAGNRSGAYHELKSAAPDLRAVVRVAKRTHLVCKSGTTVLRFG